VTIIVAATVVAIVFAVQARFDYSVLAVKDEQSESMRALRQLQADGLTTDYALLVLSPAPLDPAALEALPVVDKVVTIADYVPDDQDLKLTALADLDLLLYSALQPLRTLEAPSTAEIRELLERVRSLAAIEGRHPDLVEVLDGLRARPDQSLLIWQRGVVSNLEEELRWLRRALAVGPVTAADLPNALTDRLIGTSGTQLATVLPAEDVAPVDALSRFIDRVRALEPHATGRPVIEWGVGKIVVDSFLEALTYAASSILVLLVVMFQSVRVALLIMVPLALTALFTLAFGVLFNIPLNMANILVVPLIFGLGVDNGVHVVDRYRTAGDVERFMHSSTPRAVLLSALTTIGTFAALSLSPHQGTASIGMLLTIAVALLLLFAILLLPVLLSFLSPRKLLVERSA
jgi:predicted RND superfamily exporter protein